MFGEPFHTLERGELTDSIHHLQMALKGGGVGVELPLVRQIGRYLPMKTARELFSINDFLVEFGQAAVDNMKASSGNGRNIFANMAAEAEKGEPGMSDEDVKTEATNLIVAGSDTTAVTLTYLVWAVLSKPTLQADLVREVITLGEA